MESLECETRVLVASVRNPDDMVELARRGVNTFTFCPEVAEQLFSDRCGWGLGGEGLGVGGGGGGRGRALRSEVCCVGVGITIFEPQPGAGRCSIVLHGGDREEVQSIN